MKTASFLVATNGRLTWWLHHTLSDLTPEQLHYRTPALDDRPILEVAMHAVTVLLGHTLVIAGRDWPVEDNPPDRWPPKIVQPAEASALVATLDSLLAQVNEVVSRLTDDDLDQDVTFPWGQQHAGDALSAALTHAGGIAGIRAIGGFPVPPGY